MTALVCASIILLSPLTKATTLTDFGAEKVRSQPAVCLLSLPPDLISNLSFGSLPSTNFKKSSSFIFERHVLV